MGPDNAYLYLGPESSSGYVVYGGNRTHIPMNFFLRPGKREGSLCVLQCLESIATQNFTVLNSFFIPNRSRYFRCQNGKDYKWKIGSHRMEVRILLFFFTL